jgi:hypothetical protein
LICAGLATLVTPLATQAMAMNFNRGATTGKKVTVTEQSFGVPAASAQVIPFVSNCSVTVPVVQFVWFRVRLERRLDFCHNPGEKDMRKCDKVIHADTEEFLW